MPFQIGREKTGGRTKGTPNKVIKPVKLILASILTEEAQLKDWNKWLSHSDAHIAFEAFKLAQAYLYGKPAQQQEDNSDEITDMNFGALQEPANESRTVNQPN